jgi:hypothetical protein
MVYLESETELIGVFDVEDDAYEFQRTYAAESGSVVYLSSVTVPYRQSDHELRVFIRDGPDEGE